MIGEKDYVVENKGAKQFHKKVASSDKKIVEFKDTFHEI